VSAHLGGATLDAHRADPRPHLYTREQMEGARTHDHYWNAAMREMRATGFMHNYMRMYWAKKILEWSPEPEAAFLTILHLN
jgi:deoxyribodipyrimidine photo-lyase